MKKILPVLLLFVMLCTVIFSVNAFAASDIASGTGWNIDYQGNLYITGPVEVGKNDPMPWAGYKTQIKSAFANGNPSINNCRMMFCGCENLVSVNLINLDTSSVTNMGRMFDGCKNLTTVNLKGIKTSKVTDMYSMFGGCSALTAIDLSTFNTSKVTDMSFMFSGCSSLLSLDLSKFATYYTEDFESMFRDCSALKSINFGQSFDVKAAGNMTSMFNGCSSLTSLDLGRFRTENVYDMTHMFYGCSSLKEIYIGNFDIGNSAGRLYGMFEDCTSLSLVNANHMIISENAKQLAALSSTWADKTSYVLYNGENALKKTTGNLIISKITQEGTGWMLDYAGCLHITGAVKNESTDSDKTPWASYKSSIKAAVAHDGSSIDNCTRLFHNCSGMTYADLGRLDTSAVTSMSGMFYYCHGLKSINLDGINTSKVTDMNSMFYRCPGLTELDVSSFNTASVKDMQYMFYECWQVQNLDLSNFNTSKVTDMSCMFGKCSALCSVNVGSFDTSAVTSMCGMFTGCRNICALDISSFNTSKTKYTNKMFEECSFIAELGITGDLVSKTSEQLFELSDKWTNKATGTAYTAAAGMNKITGKVTLTRTKDNLSSGNGWYLDSTGCLHLTGPIENNAELSTNMFGKYNSIRSVVAEENSSIDSLKYLFLDCSRLTSVDLSKLDISAVKETTGMFRGCKSLKTLDLSCFDTSKVTDMASMFKYCDALKEVNLTSFDTSNVITTNYMFEGCSSLEKLDLRSFNTQHVESAAGMFKGCKSLKTLEFGADFTTENVNNMSEMFSDCASLTKLDLNTFDTSNVNRMEKMFYGCSSLQTLDVRHFNLSSVYSDELKNVFTGCNNIRKIGINSALLSGTAGQFIGIFPTWKDTADDTLYCYAKEFQNISGKVTLVRSCKVHTEVKDEGISPTCTEKGMSEGYHCSVCESCLMAQAEIPATGHNAENAEAIEATCTKAGNKAGAKCSVCGVILAGCEPIAAKGHTEVSDKAVAATCTTDGKTEGKHCSVCGTVTVAQTTVAKKEHTYKNVITKATLTANGKSTPTCSVCGAKKTATVIYKASGVKISAASYTYNGKIQKPTLTVKDSNGNTISSKYYTAKWSNESSKSVGTYTVKITFKTRYTGTKTLTYKILPKQVTGLKASTVAKTSVKLTWTKVTGAKYYKVEQSTDGKTWKVVKTVDTNALTVSSLTAGKKYQFRVTALDSTKALKGKTSAVLKTGTLTAAPTVTLTAKSKSATASWKKITGASKYIVYKSTDGKKYTKVTETTSLTYTLTKLTAGKKIYVKVKAVNAYGKTSAYSTVKSVTVKK